MKHSFLIFLICTIHLSIYAQKRSKTGNPYLDRKVRPSEEQLQADSKLNAKELRDFKENTKRSKRGVLSANSEFYTKKKYKRLEGKSTKKKSKRAEPSNAPMF
jgi:hypothetical protein